MNCHEEHVHSRSEARPEADFSVIDGAVLVNILTFRPVGCKTLGDYVAKMFLPYVKREQNMTQRVDIVWDPYLENSLKAQTREIVLLVRVSGDA